MADLLVAEADAQNAVITRAAAAAAGTYGAGGCTVVDDGVLGPWFWEEFATASGVADLHIAVLLPPLARCQQRVATRTGHGFTDPAATRHMHDDFTRAAIDPRHLITVTGDADAEHVTAEVLGRYRAGSLRRTPGVRAGLSAPDGGP